MKQKHVKKRVLNVLKFQAAHNSDRRLLYHTQCPIVINGTVYIIRYEIMNVVFKDFTINKIRHALYKLEFSLKAFPSPYIN